MTRAGSSGRSAISLASVGPLTSSMVKKSRPSGSSAKSYSSTMWSEPTREAALASVRNSLSARALAHSSRLRIFRATRRSRSVCSASYTVPMPPSPRNLTIR